MGPYQSIWDHIGPYRTMQDQLGPWCRVELSIFRIKTIFLQSVPFYDISVPFYDKVFRFMIFIENFEIVSVT